MKVHEDLHDAGEGHQAGAGDEEDVDVFKGQILLLFGLSSKHLEEGMSGSDLVA